MDILLSSVVLYEKVISSLALLNNLISWQFPARRTQPFTCRLFFNADASVVKPLELAVVVVASDHVSKGTALAETIQGVILFALILILPF